jgi:hypothetical protein
MVFSPDIKKPPEACAGGGLEYFYLTRYGVWPGTTTTTTVTTRVASMKLVDVCNGFMAVIIIRYGQ